MQLFLNELFGAVGQLLLFCLIPFIWWLVTARKENFFSWIGLKKGHCKSSSVKIIVMILTAVGAYAGLSVLCIQRLPEGITTAGGQFAGMGSKAIPATLLYGYIRTGLSEEIVFRGFILKRCSAKFNFVVGNTVQAVLFGFMHGIPFGLATGNVLVMILLTVLPGAFGWFEGWLNEKHFEGSILPSWLIHGTINLITALLSL